MSETYELELDSLGHGGFGGDFDGTNALRIAAGRGIHLDGNHLKFLSKQNGGFTRGAIYEREAIEIEVGVFYSWHDPHMHSEYGVWGAYENWTKSGGNPDLYPFAESPGGDIFLMDKMGRVVLHRHDQVEDIVLSETFDEFVCALRY